MKALKFTDAQKAFILKQGADGHPVAEICRRVGSNGPRIQRARVVKEAIFETSKQKTQRHLENGAGSTPDGTYHLRL